MFAGRCGAAELEAVYGHLEAGSGSLLNPRYGK